MKGTVMIKRTAIGSAMLASVMAGALWAQVTGGAAAPATTGPAVGPPTTAPATDTVFAVVNGQPISSRWFNEMLMAVAGRRVFPQALDLILVQQDCAENGISMQGKEFQERVQAEIDRSLALAAPDANPADRAKIMAQVLQRYGRTEQEFLIAMNVSAGLRALSVGRVEDPTDAEIQEGFKAKYGAQVKIKVITVPSTEAATDVRAQVEGKKATLDQVAQSKGYGLQEMTISANDQHEELKKIKEAAEALTTPGQLSPVIAQNLQQGSAFHMVMLEEKIAEQKGVTLAAPGVKEKVTEAVRNAKQQAWMSGRLQILQRKAKVEIKDLTLSALYAATTQAATQSATQPAPKK